MEKEEREERRDLFSQNLFIEEEEKKPHQSPVQSLRKDEDWWGKGNHLEESKGGKES